MEELSVKDLSDEEQRGLDQAYAKARDLPTELQQEAHSLGFADGWIAAHLWLTARVVFEGERQ